MLKPFIIVSLICKALRNALYSRTANMMNATNTTPGKQASFSRGLDYH